MKSEGRDAIIGEPCDEITQNFPRGRTLILADQEASVRKSAAAYLMAFETLFARAV